MDVRERILEAAAALYSTVGFRGTTTRRIAADAGVNEVTLFRHFGSKEALIREVISRGWSRFCFEALPEQPGDPATEIAEWALRYYGLHAECAAFIRTRLGEFQEHPEILPTTEPPPPARIAALLAAYLERLQQEGRMRPDIRPARAAAMLIGALFADAITRVGVVQMYGTSPDEDVRQYVQIFLRGIGVTS
ncbi:MAG TPA: TetR/AcrR family transcriptional regulator [Gemmatimonadales bacterium]|jgi:AcrR family transcriptional regulator|nr:TetR/AcrR family transcriptional regulator [Gemmatimonadales bacterium]